MLIRFLGVLDGWREAESAVSAGAMDHFYEQDSICISGSSDQDLKVVRKVQC